MKIHLRYFASVRELMGTGQATVQTQATHVGALRLELMALSPQHAEALAPQKAVRAALNQVTCTEDAALSDGDEVAFFPPVTGG
jgi:molybdopterin synthase sulfur carrier subunit